MSEPRDHGRPHLAVLPGGAEGRSDDALVSAFLAGDEAAFGELWRRHAPAAHAAVRRFARTPEDGADLVQRAFLRALEAARRRARLPFRGAFPFRPFILRVALNLAKNHARDEARWRRAPIEAVDGDALAAGDAPADASLIDAERARLVRGAMRELPARQRQVLSLRVDAGLSFAEVALALGITEGNARVAFHHAARRLRASLAPSEGEP